VNSISDLIHTNPLISVTLMLVDPLPTQLADYRAPITPCPQPTHSPQSTPLSPHSCAQSLCTFLRTYHHILAHNPYAHSCAHITTSLRTYHHILAHLSPHSCAPITTFLRTYHHILAHNPYAHSCAHITTFLRTYHHALAHNPYAHSCAQSLCTFLRTYHHILAHISPHPCAPITTFLRTYHHILAHISPTPLTSYLKHPSQPYQPVKYLHIAHHQSIKRLRPIPTPLFALPLSTGRP
jgi:hypothetical protein